MNIKRRFFVIATASFLATVTSCSSPQNNGTTTTASNPTATTAANTVATGVKEKIKVGVSPVPAGEILEFVKKISHQKQG